MIGERREGGEKVRREQRRLKIRSRCGKTENSASV